MFPVCAVRSGARIRGFHQNAADEEELPWEWDFIGPGSSHAEIRSELEDMLCGVALADAGFASCAACAWLFIRNAQQLALDMDSSPHPHSWVY